MTNISRNLGDKSKRQRSLVFMAWGAFAFSVMIYVGFAYLQHQRGESWTSAFDLPLDRDYFRLVGDFIVPVMALVFMMQTINKLPASREKTTLRWIGWVFFVFLFVWWSPLRITLFGSY